MFKIYTDPTKKLPAFDHIPLVNKLTMENKSLADFENINSFNYAALPEVPSGTFLVNMNQWIDYGLPTTGTNQQVNLDIGDITFTNLFIEYIKYFDAPNQNMSSDEKFRFAIVKLTKLVSTEYYEEVWYGTWSDWFDTPTGCFALTSACDIAMNFGDGSSAIYFPQQSYQDIIGEVANLNFITAYIGRSSAGSALPKVSNTLSTISSFIRPDFRVLSQHFAVNRNPGHLIVGFQTNDKNSVSLVASASTALAQSESEIYTINAFSEDTLYAIDYPFHHLSYGSLTLDGDANSIVTKLASNAGKRLLRTIEVEVMGVLDIHPTIDIHNIIYKYTENGFTTLVKSRHWKLAGILDFPKAIPCSQRIETFTLDSGWFSGGALASINSIGDKIYTIKGVVEDPDGIFASVIGYGQKGLAIATCDKRHIVIQAGCDQTVVLGPTVIGKCVVSYQDGKRPQRSICVNTSSTICAAIGGTYSGDGSTC